MTQRQTLPSLNALVALEAAVRHRSFTQAAAELGVTQAAVSRHVSGLEEELRVQLFVRKHRAIEPTPACVLLAATLSRSLDSIADSVDMVRTERTQPSVTIGATMAFSSFWLLPRLADFRKLYPAAQIRVISQDARIALGNGDVDVIVRFGNPPFDDGTVVASRPDEVFPVCAPQYARGLEEWPAALGSRSLELIEQVAVDRTWYSWQEWLLRAGLSSASTLPRLRLNQYTEVIQAACSGQGVALGWQTLIERHLAEGSLVRVGNSVVTAEGRYNVVLPLRRKPHPLRDVLVEWLADSISR